MSQKILNRLSSPFTKAMNTSQRGIYWLTNPSSQFVLPIQRSQARLLSLFIVTTFFILLILLTRAIQFPSISTDAEKQVLTIACSSMIGLYFLSRSPYYFQTALITVISMIITVLMIFNASSSPLDFAYLSIVMLIASLLFNLRILSVIIAGTMLAAYIVVQNNPALMINSDILIFFGIACLVVIIASYYRNNQEFRRTATLIDREARLQLMLEQMPAILWTTDRDLVITSSTGSGFANISITAEELTNKWIGDAPPMEKLSMFRTDAHYRSLEGESTTYESQWGDYYFQCFVEPLYDVHDEIVGCVGVALDITARHSIEQSSLDLLVEKERVQILSDFIQNASHDLQNPLSVMNASIYLLKKSTNDNKIRRHVDIVELQTQHLSDMVKNMLTMLRLDNLDQMPKTYVNINSLVSTLPISHETTIQRKRLTLHLDLEDGLPQIEANESYLAQALNEILFNAIQFTNINGEISIHTRRDEERVVIDISDTGVGIAPEDQAHIFERFYRVDKARSSATGGAGLGLAIAKKIIDGHAGRIHVQSMPAEGSTFRIYLPIEPELYAIMHS